MNFKTVTIGADTQHAYDIKIPTQAQYFNIEHYLPQEFDYWRMFLFVTRRNVGKNYSTIKWLNKYDKTFVIIRRTEVDIKELQDDIDRNWPKQYGLIRKGANIYNCVWQEDEERGGFYIPTKWRGNIARLSGAASKAGGNSVGVDVIWYDEFISHGRYLSNETRKLISIVNSMVRNNNKAILIATSNPLSKAAPLFQSLQFWDDQLIEWSPRFKAVKIMFEKDTFKPMENEEETLGYLLASTSQEEIDVNIYGTFGRNSDRDNQMKPIKYYQKRELQPMWSFSCDSMVKGEDPFKGMIAYSTKYKHYIQLPYDYELNIPHWALTLKESVETGNKRIGGEQKATWIYGKLKKYQLYFTDFDIRYSLMNFTRRHCKEVDNGLLRL